MADALLILAARIEANLVRATLEDDCRDDELIKIRTAALVAAATVFEEIYGREPATTG